MLVPESIKTVTISYTDYLSNLPRVADLNREITIDLHLSGVKLTRDIYRKIYESVRSAEIPQSVNLLAELGEDLGAKELLPVIQVVGLGAEYPKVLWINKFLIPLSVEGLLAVTEDWITSLVASGPEQIDFSVHTMDSSNLYRYPVDTLVEGLNQVLPTFIEALIQHRIANIDIYDYLLYALDFAKLNCARGICGNTDSMLYIDSSGISHPCVVSSDIYTAADRRFLIEKQYYTDPTNGEDPCDSCQLHSYCMRGCPIVRLPGESFDRAHCALTKVISAYFHTPKMTTNRVAMLRNYLTQEVQNLSTKEQ